MDDRQGAQNAFEVALQTLNERCKHFQKHVAVLEEENVALRMKCSHRDDEQHSLNEMDHLRAHVVELTEQKHQLQNKVKFITRENQELWSKLSKLTEVNKSLGNKLTRINDTLVQHTTISPNLIRSKTFTKSELQTKVQKNPEEENDKISLELEDVSLKLTDSICKQKKDFDLLCKEITECSAEDLILSKNCGFLYDEQLEDEVLVQMQAFTDYFRSLKESLKEQQILLQKNVQNMAYVKGKLKPTREKIEKSTSTVDLYMKSFLNKSTETENEISPVSIFIPQDYEPPTEKICPICSRMFSKDVNFMIFQQHVEDHFNPENNFELL
ncbi:hypothetical protein ABEB36_011807 [Hypothenemus hampei]|uniref:UBZ1-type domain-containing protein n=1 Tax=Hypothenemus hampei TaxID=57062 RepID=A0ABD1E940_HYPHA